MTSEGGKRPEESFTRSAVTWTGGARGQVLVDAAASGSPPHRRLSATARRETWGPK